MVDKTKAKEITEKFIRIDKRYDAALETLMDATNWFKNIADERDDLIKKMQKIHGEA